MGFLAVFRLRDPTMHVELTGSEATLAVVTRGGVQNPPSLAELVGLA